VSLGFQNLETKRRTLGEGTANYSRAKGLGVASAFSCCYSNFFEVTFGISVVSWYSTAALVRFLWDLTAERMHYKKAPITEALIDIRVELSSELRFEDLSAFRKHVSTDYPREETRNLSQAMLLFGPSVQASAQQQPWGFMFRNETNTQVVQVRLDGFTFSRLEPYEDFEHLRDEARRLWDIYRELVRPKKVVRIAVRYINQLNLPGTRVEPEDYLKTFPHLSGDLPKDLRDFGPFLMNLRVPQPDLKGLLIINEAGTPPKKPETVSIILDLDLSVESPAIESEEEMWAFFQKLRERKNLYFEACITDKTRELIS